MNTKKMLFVGILTSVAIFAGIVHAEEPLKITTGSKKGNYYKFGVRIASQFKGATVQTSRGSIQNLDRLLSGKANVAIAQKDAYRWYSQKHPEIENKVEYIGDLRNECAFLVVHKDGKVKDDDDLQQKGVTIAVGKKGSGSAVTWDYMASLESGFKKATAIPQGGPRVLAKVASGQYDAALIVMTPDLNSYLFRTVQKNKNLAFGDITDWDLNDKYQGKPIYEFKKVKVEPGFFGDKVKTICTTASVFANTDAIGDDAADDLSDLLLNRKNFILGH